MTSEEIDEMNRARDSLARQRGALARRIAASDVAALSASDDLTRILLAIEAVDRALADAGRPYLQPEA